MHLQITLATPAMDNGGDSGKPSPYIRICPFQDADGFFTMSILGLLLDADI
jgi:hypothetical protein